MNDHLDEDLRETWDLLGSLPDPEPPARMQADFARALAAYNTALRQRPGPNRWGAWRAAAAVGLVAVGGAVGYLARGGPTADTGRLSTLEQEVAQLQRTQAEVLLNHASVARRLEGIRLGTSLAQTPSLRDHIVSRALHDENVNVRLAALEAIAAQPADDALRTALTDAIDREASPLVLAVLIELCVALEIEAAADALARLEDREGLHPDVLELATNAQERLRS